MDENRPDTTEKFSGDAHYGLVLWHAVRKPIKCCSQSRVIVNRDPCTFHKLRAQGAVATAGDASDLLGLTAGMLVGDKTGVTRKMLCIMEAMDIDDLRQEHHRTEFTDAGNCLEQLY